MSIILSRPVQKHKTLFTGLFLFSLAALLGLGVMAKNGWLPSTDPLSGKRTGWFGRELPKNASSSWNILPTPTPTPLPLSKEYIYAGGRLLAVEDANANAAPPADIAVWRPSNGTWYVLGGAGSQQFSAQWGSGGDPNANPPVLPDVPVPGDFDGDGKTDISIFRPSDGKWYIAFSHDNSYDIVQWATSGDKPVPADYDGDGKTDIAVYRPSNGHWYILKSSDLGGWDINWGGQTGDKFDSADYDGDGRADICIWRPSNKTFYVLPSSTNYSQYTTQALGTKTTDIPVSADYDGDGKADYAVFDPTLDTVLDTTSPNWRILGSNGNTTLDGRWGNKLDTPVQNDYDADGKCDIAVWRGDPNTSGSGDVGKWYILNSGGGSPGYRIDTWGTTNDIPVPAYFRR